MALSFHCGSGNYNLYSICISWYLRNLHSFNPQSAPEVTDCTCMLPECGVLEDTVSSGRP